MEDDEQTTPGASDADTTAAGYGDDSAAPDAVTASVDNSRDDDDDEEEEEAADTDADEDGPAPAKTPDKVEDLPPWAQKIITEARKGEGDFRKRARQAEEKATSTEAKLQSFLDGFAKVLGLAGDEDAAAGGTAEPADPEQLTRQLTAAQQEHRATQVELAVYRAAGIYEGDADALLDSRAFLDKVLKFDPNAEEFHENVGAAIYEAIEANPKLRTEAPAAPVRSAPSGGEFSGGPAERTDAESLSVDDFRKRRRDRRGN